MRQSTPHAQGRRFRLGALFLFALGAFFFGGVVPSYHRADFEWAGCHFREKTALLCPGCGMMRASRSLRRGEWRAAYKYHPLWVVILASGGLWLAVGVLRPQCFAGWWKVMFVVGWIWVGWGFGRNVF